MRLDRNLQDLERELAVIREATQLIEREIMKRAAAAEETTPIRHDSGHWRKIS